jgi:hypothetical protein
VCSSGEEEEDEEEDDDDVEVEVEEVLGGVNGGAGGEQDSDTGMVSLREMATNGCSGPIAMFCSCSGKHVLLGLAQRNLGLWGQGTTATVRRLFWTRRQTEFRQISSNISATKQTSIIHTK